VNASIAKCFSSRRESCGVPQTLAFTRVAARLGNLPHNQPDNHAALLHEPNFLHDLRGQRQLDDKSDQMVGDQVWRLLSSLGVPGSQGKIVWASVMLKGVLLRAFIRNTDSHLNLGREIGRYVVLLLRFQH
jgi:hypothetical protein